MSDVELAIKIPEEIYIHLLSRYKYQDTNDIGLSEYGKVGVAIKNGIPLPKSHGKLVDLDQMCQDYWDGNYMEIHFNDLDNIKTIIEADETESEEK